MITIDFSSSDLLRASVNSLTFSFNCFISSSLFLLLLFEFVPLSLLSLLLLLSLNIEGFDEDFILFLADAVNLDWLVESAETGEVKVRSTSNLLFGLFGGASQSTNAKDVLHPAIK